MVFHQTKLICYKQHYGFCNVGVLSIGMESRISYYDAIDLCIGVLTGWREGGNIYSNEKGDGWTEGKLWEKGWGAGGGGDGERQEGGGAEREARELDLIYWMFYDQLSAHSLVAKLGRWGWLMRMRLAWKKSQKALDTSKRLHRIKTQSTGSAGKGLGESAGASRLKAPSGGVQYPSQVAPTTGSLTVVPPRPKAAIF